MAPLPESAEEACQRAEALFLAGDARAAHRMAQRAQTLSPALPGVASALAAYAVHAAAANRGGRPDWRAVLGLGRAQEPLDAGLSEHDVIRRQFRRMSLLVHPDKNPSAAAEGAFKLLRQACDALSATASRRRPASATAASAAAAGHSHHQRSYATAAGMRGTYAEAATKHAPSPATTKKSTTATAGNYWPNNDTAAKHTADHWRNTSAYASAAGLDDDYDYDYHDDYYDYSSHYYNYHGQDDTAETYTPAASHKDDDGTAETRSPAAGNKDGDHDGSRGPREDTRIICLSCDCESGLTKPVGVPVPGSECSWCGQTMTRVSGAAMD
ncbi:hypothetical protein ACQJBY_035675 [Aegilops geniculata]